MARDFDDVGPEACINAILGELLDHNPHYLEMAIRCAKDLKNPDGVVIGFAMFYRVLAHCARDRGTRRPADHTGDEGNSRHAYPRLGEERFVLLATDTPRDENSWLLRMADSFSSRQANYLATMQAFALLYKCLSAQPVIGGMMTLCGGGNLDRPKGPPALEA